MIIFAPVKKWLGYILSLYILLSTLVPCYIFDNCEDEQKTEQTSNSQQKKDCDNCSPFCVCSSAHSFTNNRSVETIEPLAFENLPVYNGYYLSSSSEYHSSLFQPPRLG